MTVRSTVSADISMHVIWVNSTDFYSTVKAVKVHEILVSEFGYTDSLILEEGNRGKGEYQCVITLPPLSRCEKTMTSVQNKWSKSKHPWKTEKAKDAATSYFESYVHFRFSNPS
ncbi:MULTISPECIES: hypothetical protein [unclassified Vibrio]|uniref:hypothetical protein n=1 Tax=unclassified Vibrio TaxID=2614977 RepID=UPI00352D985E